MTRLTSVEICAGAGGQAIGLEQAGFSHEAVVEIDADACETLRRNRGSAWKIIEDDIANVDGRGFTDVDLLAGGVPCPPFSIAGKQLGEADDRDLFPQALRLVEEIRPRAVLLENVRGLATTRFDGYRAQVLARLHALGYETWWDLVNASDHGVPQLRPRFVLIAIREPWARAFRWPEPANSAPLTVGEALADLMSVRGWPGAEAWAEHAASIAPTIVGGSKKHGGPDLGPTRARAAWKELGVDGIGIADDIPGPDFQAGKMPKLTVRMVARIQGFPDDWEITGRKTAAYRQVGNAFPPPVARAFGAAIAEALKVTSGSPTDENHHASLRSLTRPDVRSFSHEVYRRGAERGAEDGWRVLLIADLSCCGLAFWLVRSCSVASGTDWFGLTRKRSLVQSQYRPRRYRRSQASSRSPGLAFMIVCPWLVRRLCRHQQSSDDMLRQQTAPWLRCFTGLVVSVPPGIQSVLTPVLSRFGTSGRKPAPATGCGPLRLGGRPAGPAVDDPCDQARCR